MEHSESGSLAGVIATWATIRNVWPKACEQPPCEVGHALAGGNTHSVELLPDGNLVSASSTGGYLRVFSTDPAVSRPPGNVRCAEVALASAHGVAWDHRLGRLWAIGGDELVRYRYNGNRQEPALQVDARFLLPNRGGHDLFPMPGTRRLFLTAGKAWTFDTQTGLFEPFSPVSQGDLKSISQREPGGPIIVMAATESWWSDTIRFVGPSGRKKMSQARFYKARWWVPNPFSYGQWLPRNAISTPASEHGRSPLQHPQLVHTQDQPLGQRAGRRRGVAGVLQNHDEGQFWCLARHVAGKPGMGRAAPARLRRARLAGHADRGQVHGGMGGALRIGNRPL